MRKHKKRTDNINNFFEILSIPFEVIHNSKEIKAKNLHINVALNKKVVTCNRQNNINIPDKNAVKIF